MCQGPPPDAVEKVGDNSNTSSVSWADDEPTANNDNIDIMTPAVQPGRGRPCW